MIFLTLYAIFWVGIGWLLNQAYSDYEMYKLKRDRWHSLNRRNTDLITKLRLKVH